MSTNLISPQIISFNLILTHFITPQVIAFYPIFTHQNSSHLNSADLISSDLSVGYGEFARAAVQRYAKGCWNQFPKLLNKHRRIVVARREGVRVVRTAKVDDEYVVL